AANHSFAMNTRRRENSHRDETVPADTPHPGAYAPRLASPHAALRVLSRALSGLSEQGRGDQAEPGSLRHPMILGAGLPELIVHHRLQSPRPRLPSHSRVQPLGRYIVLSKYYRRMLVRPEPSTAANSGSPSGLL